MPEDHNAEMDALAAQLAAAGLLHILTRADGGTDYQLTERGVQVARQMALSSKDDALALLDAVQAGTTGG